MAGGTDSTMRRGPLPKGIPYERPDGYPIFLLYPTGRAEQLCAEDHTFSHTLRARRPPCASYPGYTSVLEPRASSPLHWTTECSTWYTSGYEMYTRVYPGCGRVGYVPPGIPPRVGSRVYTTRVASLPAMLGIHHQGSLPPYHAGYVPPGYTSTMPGMYHLGIPLPRVYLTVGRHRSPHELLLFSVCFRQKGVLPGAIAGV